MFVKDIKTVILMKEGHQQGAEEQKENKIHGYLKKIPASWTLSSEPGEMTQIYVNNS
jgi:hypothetical protein